MTVPMADLPAQYTALKPELDAAISQVMSTGGFILGPTVAACETQIAAICGARHGIGVGNGTDALLLSLMALGVGPGDEVITPPFTFVATVETVVLLGATPVFADIDPVHFTLDPADVAKKITPRTKAIVPVHLFGQLADMDGLRAFGLPLIGDGAQAIGAAQKGQKVAQWTDLTTLSFYPTKNLGAAGDGGMILTNDDSLADKLRLLRFHGSGGKYDYHLVGVCSRLDALQAAILNIKLPHLAAWNEARRTNASYYDAILAGCDGLALPATREGNVHTFHQYTVRVLNGQRTALKAFLAERGVATGIFYPVALHLSPIYQQRFSGKPGDHPESERACEEVLSLPIYPELSAEQRVYVAESILAFFGG
jgi:dTDP-4-amino-4,6-dideoxygalactose transaminase